MFRPVAPKPCKKMATAMSHSRGRLYIAGANIKWRLNMAEENGHGALSILQFCKWAGIGRSLAYKEIESGQLKIKKVGRRTLVTMDAARDWLSGLSDGAG